MLNELISRWLCWLGGTPCFEIYGKSRQEQDWRVVRVYASDRRNAASRWPLWRGACTTWTDEVIVVGWDFAQEVYHEQGEAPASQHQPVEVAGGRLDDLQRRAAAGVPAFASASETLAHECGHTWQARRLGTLYLPFVGPVTRFREGPRLWNYFENQASEIGQFGGLVNGSVCPSIVSGEW